MAKRLLFIFTPQMAFFSPLNSPPACQEAMNLANRKTERGFRIRLAPGASCAQGHPQPQLRARWMLVRGQRWAAPAAHSHAPHPGRAAREPRGQPPSWAGRPRHQPERAHSYCFVYCFHFLILSLVFRCTRHIYDYILANGKTIQLILQSFGRSRQC